MASKLAQGHVVDFQRHEGPRARERHPLRRGRPRRRRTPAGRGHARRRGDPFRATHGRRRPPGHGLWAVPARPGRPGGVHRAGLLHGPASGHCHGQGARPCPRSAHRGRADARRARRPPALCRRPRLPHPRRAQGRGLSLPVSMGRPGHGQGMGLSGPLSRGGRGPPRAARDLAGRRHRRLPAMARAAW